MNEPTLSEVRAEMRTGFAHDERIRALEVGQAHADATMRAIQLEIIGLRTDGKEDKADLMEAIRASKPDAWKAMAALVGFASLVFLVAAAIYGVPKP